MRAVLGRDQPREHVQPAGGDGGVMIAASEFDAAKFDDANAPTLGAIGRRQFLQPTTPWAMLCTVLSARSAVRSSSNITVAPKLRKKMLDRQNLTAVSE